MREKIKVGAVSYLNTKPLLYGIERHNWNGKLELILEYPSRLAADLKSGNLDLALLPVAAIPGIEGAKIVSEYGIAADGKVASVCIFSQLPMEKIEAVYLDFQSRTSVKLAQILLQHFWKKDVQFLNADEHYINQISGNKAGVIIGDRALENLHRFEFVYDLSEAWKAFTGLPFVFAAWVSNKDLPADFLENFNRANAHGLSHLDDVIRLHPYPFYSLSDYYTQNIQYRLDEKMKQGLNTFLEMLAAKA